jgi:hypothetical protein
MMCMMSEICNTMVSDYYYAKHQKGNPPPFQKSKRGFDDWVKSFQSIDQHPYSILDIQLFVQQRDLMKKQMLGITVPNDHE